VRKVSAASCVAGVDARRAVEEVGVLDRHLTPPLRPQPAAPFDDAHAVPFARRLHHHLQHGGLARLERQFPARPRRPQPRRLGRGAHLGAIARAVEPVVAEHQPVTVDVRRQDAPAPRPARPAQLEHVGEVGAHAQLDPQLGAPPQVVGHHDLLQQRPVEQLLAPDMQEVLRIVEKAAELAVGEGQVDLQGRGALRLRREHQRRPARHEQLQVRQVARVLVHQAEVARTRRSDVAAPVDDAEGVAAGQDQRLGFARRGQLHGGRHRLATACALRQRRFR
jgi:hypothetical protein